MFKSANCNSLLPSAFHFLVLLSVVAIQINCSLFCLYNGYFVSFLGCPTFEPLLYLENSLICESWGEGWRKAKAEIFIPSLSKLNFKSGASDLQRDGPQTMHGSSRWRESLWGCVSRGSSAPEQQWCPAFRARVMAVQARGSHGQWSGSTVCLINWFCGMIWDEILAVTKPSLFLLIFQAWFSSLATNFVSYSIIYFFAYTIQSPSLLLATRNPGWYSMTAI